MRYFYRLLEGMVVLPMMDALMRNPQLWDTDPVRTTFDGTPHGQVSDILLRFGKPDGDDLETADRDAMKLLPRAKELSLNVMQVVGGSRLGRVIITRLESGREILPHADVMGLYSQYYSRYHLVLQGKTGSVFSCGDEAVHMRSGELWWFDARQEHSVVNKSGDDRVHMLIDVRIDP